MNLRGIANRATSRVNPNLPASLRRSTGYTTAPTGKRSSGYADPLAITVQAQALTKDDIKHLDALNLSDCEMAIYASTQLHAIERTTGKGGDLLDFGAGAPIPADLQNSTWLVSAVLEGWVTAGWSRVAVTRQMPGGPA